MYLKQRWHTLWIILGLCQKFPYHKYLRVFEKTIIGFGYWENDNADNDDQDDADDVDDGDDNNANIDDDSNLLFHDNDGRDSDVIILLVIIWWGFSGFWADNRPVYFVEYFTLFNQMLQEYLSITFFSLVHYYDFFFNISLHP